MYKKILEVIFMRKLGIFLIILVSVTFFNFNEKIEAAAVPISENELGRVE